MKRPLQLARWLAQLLVRDLRLKLLATAVTAVLFVLTRDEVERVFEVPVRVVQDPHRELLTEVPKALKVRVRGPWTRVNRLTAYDLGSAVLDLRQAEPGPLQIERGSIVMPPGVMLAGMEYDQVDLRFDPVRERQVPVVPPVAGQPHPDYRLVRVETRPAQWTIRGGQSRIRPVGQLSTEAFDISGAESTVEGVVSIVPPGAGIELVGAQHMPKIRVRAVIEPARESRELAVPLVPPPDAAPMPTLPPSYVVRVSGPKPLFRKLDALGLPQAVVPAIAPGPVKPDGGRVVRVEFAWAEGVPAEIRDGLTLQAPAQELSIPAPPIAEPPERAEQPTAQPG